MKSIYSFTVNTTEEVEEKTKEKRKNKETGQEEEIEVSKKVTKDVPHKIIIKEPSRRQLEDADMEYSIEISRCIKKGILTKAMLAKKYSDTGGILTEKDAQRLVDLYSDLADLELEMAKRGSTPNAKQKDGKDQKGLGGKIAMARREIVNLESAYQSLFNHTADIKAQNRVILWYMVNLAHVESDKEGKETAPLFEGKDFEQRIDDYYKKDEEGDSLLERLSSKLAAVISYWYFSERPTQEEFDGIINEFDS
jgi:hypothetical protein